MSHTRRDFIKFVVAGSVSSGCPPGLPAPPLGASPAVRSPEIHGEQFAICHQVRDGHSFEHPAPEKSVGVAIIGGGIAGLSGAYFLRDTDFLLLEKEDHFGGNAYQEEFNGSVYGTGSAYAYRGDDGDALAKEIGLILPAVDAPDPTIVNQTFVPDTWKTGLDHLPYPKETVASFKKFRDDVMNINVRERMLELDAQPFSKYTAGYAPEIQQWWDGYGPSNWGARTEDTSAFVGLFNLQDLVKGGDGLRVILPGGLGSISHKLVEVLEPKYGERMLTGATVVAVVPDREAVRITYLRGGRLATVSAKCVLLAAPKHIASRVVSGLPSGQKTAMRRIRYAPFPLINMIFDRPVYNRGYDNWCPGNSFTDFIVADWTIRNNPGYRQNYNILSFYTPLREDQRSTLLDENDCRTLALGVLSDFQKLLPEFKVDPIEIRLFRRGHPMYMSVPGLYTQNRPVAAQPMDRIFFGNADSGGPESLTSEAVRLSHAGAQWARMVLAGKPGARALAEKAVRDVVL